MGPTYHWTVWGEGRRRGVEGADIGIEGMMGVELRIWKCEWHM